MLKSSRVVVFTQPTSTLIRCRVSYEKQKKGKPMSRQHYTSEFAAICDTARWEEHIVKGCTPSSFKATRTTLDGSIRNFNARQKAENERLYAKGKELLRLNIKSVDACTKPQAPIIDKKYLEKRRLGLRYYRNRVTFLELNIMKFESEVRRLGDIIGSSSYGDIIIRHLRKDDIELVKYNTIH